MWLFALVGWPALSLLALYPELAPVCIFALGVLLIVAVSDAILSRDRLRSVRIVAPDLVRFAKGRKGALELPLVNDGARELPVRVALSLPSDFEVDGEEL
ncbi:MAG TPA: hypothetical protein VF551_02795, partial [Chthoniobacterales bacterium]